MANGKIRVKLRAFDVELIDQSAKSIVQTVQKAGHNDCNRNLRWRGDQRSCSCPHPRYRCRYLRFNLHRHTDHVRRDKEG